MIEVSLINGSQIVLNSDLIEFIEATPDTIISLSTGKKVIVRESVSEVVDKIVEFRRKVGASNYEQTKMPETKDS
ncbi:MAG TPA: flagellar FlbD family protein [Armatimonadota bacterium]|nr:flagellar FlbD family protein [Armatimonadota bacterium]HOM70717.1 flagellar FlbD family protein [Armatimonadota bacterium]HPP75634.1 flagellar FlbD family protein [Armatimonadota bacterium]